MPGVILGITVENRTALGVDMRRELDRIHKRMMQDVGEEFASEHIAPHFGPANRTRFKHEKRNDLYANKIKREEGVGQGKYVDNVLSGRTRRQVLTTARVTATKNKATVRATAPTYFTKPFIGSFMKKERQANGKVRMAQKRVTRQPDKLKELEEIDRKDVAELAKFAIRRARKYFNEVKATKRKRIG